MFGRSAQTFRRGATREAGSFGNAERSFVLGIAFPKYKKRRTICLKMI